MERDSQAHPIPVESESASELRTQGTKSSKEARAQRAQPPPQTYIGLCPSSKILREVWLVPRSVKADLGSHSDLLDDRPGPSWIKEKLT